MEVGRATKEATLGTNGARADTVVSIFSIRVLRSSTDFWRSPWRLKNLSNLIPGCYVRGWMGLNWREERGAGCNRGELQGEVRDLGELVPSETSPITERRQGKTERRDWETR